MALPVPLASLEQLPSSAAVAAAIGGGLSLVNTVVSILLNRYLRDLDEKVRSRRHPQMGAGTDAARRGDDSGAEPGAGPGPHSTP